MAGRHLIHWLLERTDPHSRLSSILTRLPLAALLVTRWWPGRTLMNLGVTVFEIIPLSNTVCLNTLA
jgi:hypothetical protein